MVCPGVGWGGADATARTLRALWGNAGLPRPDHRPELWPLGRAASDHGPVTPSLPEPHRCPVQDGPGRSALLVLQMEEGRLGRVQNLPRGGWGAAPGHPRAGWVPLESRHSAGSPALTEGPPPSPRGGGWVAAGSWPGGRGCVGRPGSSEGIPLRFLPAQGLLRLHERLPGRQWSLRQPRGQLRRGGPEPDGPPSARVPASQQRLGCQAPHPLLLCGHRQ